MVALVVSVSSAVLHSCALSRPMSLPAISINNLSKRYHLHHQAGSGRAYGYRTLREEVRHWMNGMMAKGREKAASDEFWALKDVTFDVEEGGMVGIIGRNGAGKSTLLKILSRIVEPTAGEVSLRGRVASLLEVGTGFHPELTGRENIFLNGAVLGMTRNEVRSKFDEIVAFAEVDRFLDTPVKRYSSGMYVRLAFAVAAHLEPEILIVDEVLAVGDVQFQKKCLGKMSAVAKEGRTVLMVTHNLGFVSDVCRTAVLLEAGRVTQTGDAISIVHHYLKGGAETSEADLSSLGSAGDQGAVLLRLRLLGEDLQPKHTFQCHDPVVVEVTFEVRQEGVRPQPSVHFITERGEHAFASVENSGKPAVKGVNVVRLVVPGDFFNGISYAVSVFLASHSPSHVHGSAAEVLSFTVLDSPVAAARATYTGPFPGCIRPLLQWHNASNS